MQLLRAAGRLATVLPSLQDTDAEQKLPLDGNKLLSADGGRLTSLQAAFALTTGSKAGKLLTHLTSLRQADASIDLQEPWSSAYEELSNKAAAKLRYITSRINEQLDDRKTVKWIPKLSLDLSKLPHDLKLAILQAVSEDPATQGSSLQLTDEAVQQFQIMWSTSDAAASPVFIVLEQDASADSLFQHLRVNDQSAVLNALKEEPQIWGGGRVAYIGIVLHTETHIKAVQKLLEPVIEPVLSLLLSVEWGGTSSLEMIVQMHMRNKKNPEVRLTSSTSTRTAVGDLIHDIAAELKARLNIDIDSTHSLQLLHLSLQRDEGTEAVQLPQELYAGDPLASLLLSKHSEAVAEAFGEDNTEARLWVATLQVSVDQAQLEQQLAATTAQEEAESATLPTAPESPGYLPPAVNSNQNAVANEIIQRILLAKRFLQDEPDSYKRGLERLRDKYRDGLDFVVLTPVYLTLRQQTLQRLQDAGLKNSDGSDPVVLPYAFSAPTTKLFDEFRKRVVSAANANKLFVMVVDEAHHAAVRRGAHDAFANDFRCQTANGEPKHGAWKSGYTDVPGEWCACPNLITVLVSATPACVLTADSRLPRRYYVPNKLTSELSGAMHLRRFSIIKPDTPHTKLDATAWTCGEHQIQAADLRELILHKVVRELHVISWSDAEVERVPYRSINDYVASSTKPRSCHHGIFGDDGLHSRMVAARALVKDVDIDVLLALDYIISMQYFRIFRWDDESSADARMELLKTQESQHLVWHTPQAVQEFLHGLNQIAENVQTGLSKAVCAMLRHPIRAAVVQAEDKDGSQHWLFTKYHELETEHGLPEWPQSYRKQEDGKWNCDADSFDLAALRVWLHCKMAAEDDSHLSGLHSAEHERQFTATDRIVKTLLVAKAELIEGDSMSRPGAQHTTPSPYASIHSAVTGPMIVIRARPDGMGEKIVNVLKEFLTYTQTLRKPWQIAPEDKLPSWQLFEVIGDFGESDQTELLNKLSPWARQRPMSTDHPGRNEQGFKEYWQKNRQVPSLQSYADYVQAKEKAERARAVEAGQKPSRKSAGLQYSDLYGVSTILVLCEKGRMGDTFPHTFTCQDQRLRSGSKYSTLVQELGRLCRYPAVQPPPHPKLLQPTSSSLQTKDIMLYLLEQALHEAYGNKVWRGVQTSAWHNVVNTIAAASSNELRDLVRALHDVAADSKAANSNDGQAVYEKLKQTIKAVLDMPEASLDVPQPTHSLRSILGHLSDDLQHPTAVPVAKPHDVLATCVKTLTTWRQHVLMTLDGSGHLLSSKNAPEFKDGLPVRIMVNGKFEADCLDSIDMVQLFCCPPAKSSLVQPDSVVSIARHKHVLPYALVTRDFANQLEKIQEATMLKREGSRGKSLGKAAQMLSEDVMENWPTGGKVDKFMAYAKPGLRGLLVHDYRDAATATNKHYDTHKFRNLHVHNNRFLLKAQPQQGKTGAYIGLLQQLGTILESSDKWQPTPAAPALQPPGLKPKQIWFESKGATLRWQNSCFQDLNGNWRAYGSLRSGKYATRVAMQRTILLASSCFQQARHSSQEQQAWSQRYKELLMGVKGENISTQAGRGRADKMAQALQHLPSPVVVSIQEPQEMTIHIANKECFRQAISWDGRIDEATAELVAGPEQVQTWGTDMFGPGIRLAHAHGSLHIVIQDAACIQAVKSLCSSKTEASLQYNLVQEMLWPQTPFVNSAADATEDASDANDLPGSWTSATMERGPAYLPQNGFMAHTMRIGRVLRPVPVTSTGFFKAKVPDLDLMPDELQKLFPKKQEKNLLAAYGPVFLATPAVWDKLKGSSQYNVQMQHERQFSVAEKQLDDQALEANSIRHWVFVPSYDRYADHNPRQMRIDWADAVSHDTSYVRVIVVRSEEQQVLGYSRLLHEHQVQVEKHLPETPHVTLMMVLPAVVDMRQLPTKHADLQPYQRQRLTEKMGIGYARLCIQLVAKLMNLSSIWVLDDNLSDCWRLPFEQFISSQGQHGQLEPVSFDTVMKTIEHQTLRATARATHFGQGDVITQKLKGQLIADAVNGSSCQERRGLADAGPRKYCRQFLKALQSSQPETFQNHHKAKTPVETMSDLTGDYSTYGVIGVDFNIRDARQVGLDGCPGPWTVTPSVYSMLLINVASTMKQGAIYPAKPYHEDVDFAHLCEEKQLVVAKCNWLFFHKARLTADFVWNQSNRGKAVTVLRPADGQMHSGQLFRFSAPSSFGEPSAISIGGKEAKLGHVVCEEASDATSLATYVACMVLLPEGRTEVGQLTITFGESGDKTLRTRESISLRRLYAWEPGTTYYAPFQLADHFTITDLGQQSQKLQLRHVIDAVREMNVSPLLVCDGEDDASTSLGFKQYHSVQEEAAAHTGPVVWLSNSSLLAQTPRELSVALGLLAAVLQKSVLRQDHGIHYLVMRYSLANAQKTLEDVQGKFSADSWEVKSIFTTAKPEGSSPQPTGASTLAKYGVLPYMLVVFEVGTPPAESDDSSSEDNAMSTGMPEDCQAVAATSQHESSPNPSPSKKRAGEHIAHAGAGKKVARQPSPKAAASAVNQQQPFGTVASPSLDNQGYTPGTSGQGSFLSPVVGTSRLQKLESGSGQPHMESPESSSAQAGAAVPDPHAQQHAQSALDAAAIGPSDEQFSTPPGSPQVKRPKTTPRSGGVFKARVKAIVTVLKERNDPQGLACKGIISALEGSKDTEVVEVVEQMLPEQWVSKALGNDAAMGRIRSSDSKPKKYWAI